MPPALSTCNFPSPVTVTQNSIPRSHRLSCLSLSADVKTGERAYVRDCGATAHAREEKSKRVSGRVHTSARQCQRVRKTGKRRRPQTHHSRSLGGGLCRRLLLLHSFNLPDLHPPAFGLASVIYTTSIGRLASLPGPRAHALLCLYPATFAAQHSHSIFNIIPDPSGASPKTGGFLSLPSLLSSQSPSRPQPPGSSPSIRVWWSHCAQEEARRTEAHRSMPTTPSS